MQPSALRIDELEAALDSVESIPLVVEAQVHVGDIGLQIRQVALHRPYPVPHVSKLTLDVLDCGADRARVFEDQVGFVRGRRPKFLSSSVARSTNALRPLHDCGVAAPELADEVQQPLRLVATHPASAAVRNSRMSSSRSSVVARSMAVSSASVHRDPRGVVDSSSRHYFGHYWTSCAIVQSTHQFGGRIGGRTLRPCGMELPGHDPVVRGRPAPHDIRPEPRRSRPLWSRSPDSAGSAMVHAMQSLVCARTASASSC